MDDDPIPEIQLRNLCFSAAGKEILSKISLSVNAGEFVAIIGPNGSGKSTLLKNVYKVLVPTSGEVFLRGSDLSKLSNRQMACQMAVVTQENDANFDFLVKEVVQMGRYPRKRWMEGVSQEDEMIVSRALGDVELSGFEERSFFSLSGGEKQRVLIARALAQQTDIVVLDEPTNHLDIGVQLKVLGFLRASGKTILTALHDLELAARYCDRLYVIKRGSLIATGSPREVITPRVIEDLYNVRADVYEREGRLCIEYL